MIERIHKAFHSHVKSLILDGECVAYDLEQKKLLPFQTLSTRKRKVNTTCYNFIDRPLTRRDERLTVRLSEFQLSGILLKSILVVRTSTDTSSLTTTIPVGRIRSVRLFSFPSVQKSHLFEQPSVKETFDISHWYNTRDFHFVMLVII